MGVELVTRIKGASRGYHRDAVFRLANGQVWQQARYRYHYRYAFRPEVKLFTDGGYQMLQIDGIDEAVVVRRAQIVCEGVLTSEFSGFGGDEPYEFDNGQAWIATEHRHEHHYAHRPAAFVINGVHGLQLHVDGIKSSLAVRRA